MTDDGGAKRAAAGPTRAIDDLLGARLTDRFVVERRLGQGGMGVVYEALDEQRGERVALKTLGRADAAAIYGLKNEFRSLVDLAHPNLVRLHELFSDDGVWFFTMERVPGVTFLEHVRDQSHDAKPESADEARLVKSRTLTGDEPPAVPMSDVPNPAPLRKIHLVSTDPVESSGGPGASTSASGGAVREGALRGALAQLASGVRAIHAAGKIHRDLKPSNVLVRPDGRVTILDFGLAIAAAPDASRSRVSAAGTPIYMAPEQFEDGGACAESDWYAFGVMLYEALTGRRPYSGSLLEVREAKLAGRAPPDPRQLCATTPADLAALAMALLEVKPGKRAGADRVAEVLAADAVATQGATVAAPSPSLRRARFVGRAPELQELGATLDAIRAGSPVFVQVEGPSGVGKTTLIKQFLDGATHDGAVALVSRCYERESIPFKAIDGLIDELTRYLARRGAAAEGLLPRDIHALTRVFPVLLRAHAVSLAPRVGSTAPDAHELRRRAFAALKELLGRIADRKRLVLWIDDVQWDDVDSAALLSHVLSPPDPPALLLVATCRSEEAGQSACSKSLRKALAPEQLRTIRVGALSQPEAAELALRLLGSADAAQQRSEQIARESEGNPLFVGALAQRLREADQKAFPSLAELLVARVQQLSDPARRLLEVLSVEGRPVAQALAFRAAGLGTDGREALATLRDGNLARTGGSSDHDSVDVFHGRVRDVVIGSIAPERAKECHRELARALEAHGRADPERMSLHLFAAGEVERAAVHARQAAEQAASALAFDRAVDFYRQALLGSGDGAKWELEARLADALAMAGRSSEAGDRYLVAARSSPPERRTDLLKAASFNLLTSARASEGLAVAREAFAGVGLTMPSTPRRALFSLIRRRAWLRLRGFRYRPRPAESISPLTLTRIDLCWSTAMGLMNVDFIRAFDLATLSLLLSLEAGDPVRVGRAITVEANTASAGGPSSQAYFDKLIALADEHAQRLDDPFLKGHTASARGAAHFFRAEWRLSAEFLETGARALADIPGNSYMVTISAVLGLVARYYAGDVIALVRGVAALRTLAQARADPYLVFRMIDVSHLEALTVDRPDRVHSDLEDIVQSGVVHDGADAPFFVWLLLQAQVRLALYEGRGADAHRLMAEGGPKLEETLLLRPPISVIVYNHLRGLTALAAMHGGALSADEARRIVKRVISAVRRVEMPFAQAVVPLFEDALMSASGQSSRSGELLDRAIAGFERAEMPVFAAVAKRRRGELTGGDEGRALVSAADTWMRSQSVRDPERLARICAPRVVR